MCKMMYVERKFSHPSAERGRGGYPVDCIKVVWVGKGAEFLYLFKLSQIE